MKTALLFAGQGAQYVGMGRDFQENFPAARELFARANEVLQYDLTRVCLDGPEAELTRTEHAQPAIYLVSWIALKLLQAQLPASAFDFAAGLSLGEFTALAAADAWSFEAGLVVVRQRGQFMQEACDAQPGAMAAIIGLSEALTREVCDATECELANLNCPGQIVISGPSDRIKHACELALAAGARRALPLPVAGAYHSRLMADAQPKLRAALGGISVQAPRKNVISNVTARAHAPNPADIVEELVRQVSAPVRWQESMEYLLGEGCRRFIELGPGTTLNGFTKRIAAESNTEIQMLNVADAASLDRTKRLSLQCA